jgi:hypothetical protein
MGHSDRRAPPQRGDIWTVHYGLYALIAFNVIFAIALVYLTVTVAGNVVVVTKHMVDTLDRLDEAAIGISAIAGNEHVTQIIARVSEFTESSTLQWIQSPIFMGMITGLMARVGDMLVGLSSLDMDALGELMNQDVAHRASHVLISTDRMLSFMESKMDTMPSVEEMVAVLHHLQNLTETLEVVVGSFQHSGVSINLG